MKQEPCVCLFARENRGFRCGVAFCVFETCRPAKRTIINKICCKQWGQWQAINPFSKYNLVETLKRELLARCNTIYSL